MKLFVVAAILGVCSAARLDNAYLPPRGGAGAGFGATGAGFSGGASSFGSGGSGSFGGSSGGFGAGAGGFGAGRGSASGSYSQGGYNAGSQGGYNAGSQGGYNAGSQGGYNAGGFGGRQSADASAQILKLNSEVTAEGFQYEYETSNGIKADASGVATNGVQSQGSFSYKGDDGQDYSITYTADENGFQPRGAHLPTPPPIPEEILKALEQNARDEAAGIVDDGSYHGEGAEAGAGNGGYSAPSGQYGAPSRGFGGRGSSFGGQSSFNGQSSSFGGQSSSFGSRGSSFGGQSSGFGAPSRQYLTPNAGRGSGNGNFNAQTGYRY
ncbi:unnamed protein product [Colias eurytheme]|nr:unnamed protein product [Colias eurytheme]